MTSLPPFLTLYVFPGSCALAPHILLREAALPFTLNKLDFKTEKGFPSQYKHLNPKACVPILQISSPSTSDTVITETPAIMTYISQVAPEKKFLGRTELEIVRCYEWCNYLSSSLHGKGFGGLFRPGNVTFNPDHHISIKEKAKENISRCYQFIEDKLKENRGHWAVGNGFTVVDAYLYVYYRWGNGQGFKLRERYPEYTRLAEQVADKESARGACEAEGVPILGV
ncbi:hypothetical protein BKA63DRAFT_543627 [Paraphoma chrysanthemicola]|nr:hypothetical protein BKA63DRAFT_543627 [Paraphoma chrysanthemicola]